MRNRIKTTILGCGSSGGVPRVGGDFGACDPAVTENYRTRCSILIEKYDYPLSEQPTTILIDTSPDLRTQLLKAQVTYLDGVIFTHDHADQTHGIDDIRPLAYNAQSLINAYMDEPTTQSLTKRFGYIFEGHEVAGYPPLMRINPLPDFGNEFVIEGKGGDITLIPLRQVHGNIQSVGFRYNKTAYCNDLNILPNESMEHLTGLDYFIVDALRYKPHPSHANLDLALEWIERIKPKQAILTNLHIDMDYKTLLEILPENVVPAYDGMIINQDV
jgi:phosphoribosyl 1,2-cyclic phosphate phosphodiesterase